MMVGVGILELLVLLALAGGVVALGVFLVVSLVGRARRRTSAPTAPGNVCASPDCRAENDPGARFCRRCGRAMGS